MKLKPNIRLVDFLQQVNLCHGEVRFETDEGDVLNLKSQISKYIFLAAVSQEGTGEELSLQGDVICDCQEDVSVLSAFLQ